MKKPTLIALISTFGSLILHTLLTLHYYPLRFGISSEKSACSVNSVFDCDAVSTSAFSAFAGIPLSLWGLVTNAILAVLIIGFIIRFTEELERLLRTATYLSAFVALMSVLMGAISITQLSTYCLYCLGTYLTSFITFTALHVSNEKGYFSYFTTDLSEYLRGSKVYLFFMAGIPLLTIVTNYGIVQSYGANKMGVIVKESINHWKSGQKYDFSGEPTLVKGAKESFMTIVEFADFQCGHCKRASLPLGSFARSHSDVSFKFIVFPLDGDCNDAIKVGRGTSCRLSKATYCAGKQNMELGWAFHDAIFVDQSRFPSSGTPEKVDEELKVVVKDPSVNWEQLKTCMDSEETQKSILSMAKMGIDAQVKGTPTIYVNGRYLPRGQLIPVLQGVYNSLKK